MTVPPAFAAEVQDFFAANAEPRRTADGRWGVGPDDMLAFDERPLEHELAVLDEARSWRVRLAEAGLHWVSGPLELGGRGLDAECERYVGSVARDYEVADEHLLAVGLEIVTPILLQYGTADAQKRYLPAIRTGQIVACQLFSEPGSGSDLAGARTTARSEGDGWRLTGQKVWTSGAHLSDVGLVLCRSSSEGPKHRTLSMFTVDLRQAGVEVRPLTQMTGGASFNEVFLDGAFCPGWALVAGIGDGWSVALETLRRERDAMGGGRTGKGDPVDRLVDLARHTGASADPTIRQELARIETSRRLLGVHARRLSSMPDQIGASTGGSVLKLMLTDHLSHVAEVAMRILGPAGVADSGQWGTYAWAKFQTGTPGMRLAGGTDEIQRNVIAERGLGLPREQRPGRST